MKLCFEPKSEVGIATSDPFTADQRNPLSTWSDNAFQTSKFSFHYFIKANDKV